MIQSGRKTVTTAGKRERLSDVPTLVFATVDIFAFDTNTDRVHIGDCNVQAPTGLETGWPLSAKEALTLHNINLYDVWIDARVSGEGVSWGAETRGNV